MSTRDADEMTQAIRPVDNTLQLRWEATLTAQVHATDTVTSFHIDNLCEYIFSLSTYSYLPTHWYSTQYQWIKDVTQSSDGQNICDSRPTANSPGPFPITKSTVTQIPKYGRIKISGKYNKFYKQTYELNAAASAVANIAQLVLDLQIWIIQDGQRQEEADALDRTFTEIATTTFPYPNPCIAIGLDYRTQYTDGAGLLWYFRRARWASGSYRQEALKNLDPFRSRVDEDGVGTTLLGSNTNACRVIEIYPKDKEKSILDVLREAR